jgi:hypothetical protein
VKNSDLIIFDPSVSEHIGIWEPSASQTRYKTETIPSDTDALQRQNAENLKQIIPEEEYRGLSPNFHIHVSVSELYIPTMGLPFLLEEI